jgi:hypothetical protein
MRVRSLRGSGHLPTHHLRFNAFAALIILILIAACTGGGTRHGGANYQLDGYTAAWRVALSTGSSFGSVNAATPWAINFGRPDGMLTGDFNGDGRADIAAYGEADHAWYVALSNGTSFDVSPDSWIAGFGRPGTPDTMITGDFNGDR